MTQRENLAQAQRIVVKVGTSTLTYPNGSLNITRIENLVREISDLRNQGREVLLVSSGAIGTGANRMGLQEKPNTLPEKQALAAIGQGTLLHLYEKLFSEYNHIIAQVLLTREDLDDRLRYLNAVHALNAILKMNAIPIINENDTVAVDEIKFGDNDTLSSLVAAMVNADLLLILSDVDGLFDQDPNIYPDARLQAEIYEITSAMEEHSKTKGTAFSTGGMYTKLKAAQISMTSGVPMVIANSSVPHIIRDIANGMNIGSLFVPYEEKITSRKKWLAFYPHARGSIMVDDGCKNALLNHGKSLLAIGITDVSGDFAKGAVISVQDCNATEIARGVTNYNSEEINHVKGKSTTDIANILGSLDYDEVIHRDQLWIKA